jgi:hypothetical protein
MPIATIQSKRRRPIETSEEQQAVSAVHWKTGPQSCRKNLMAFRFRIICLAVTLFAGSAAGTFAQGYPGYPDTIMAPEHGSAYHRAEATRHGRGEEEASQAARARLPSLLGHEKFIRKLHRRGLYAARGSSGSVLPTPLPRTQLIPPEGGGTLITPTLPQEQSPTIIPGHIRPIPNLAHGPETFQDRASRCTFQSGLYNVPGNLRSQYMGACVQ